jgi:o-succinylbenzoate---CoA ligase
VTTMPDWLRQRAASTPNRIALVCGADHLSYAALDIAADTAASELQSRGVRAGQTVALLSANSTAFVIAVHAVARLGAVLMPLNLRLTPAELAFQLRDSGARHLLTSTQVVGAQHAAPLQPSFIKKELPALIAHDLDRMTASADVITSAALQDARFDLDATHTIVYTSGTTGTPKGAMLTFGNHFWSATGSAYNLGVREDDRWLAVLPLFHVGGLAILLRSVLYGTTAIVHESFDAVRTNRAIDHDGVTIVSVVANMLQRMLDGRGDKPYPASLRCVLLGGGPAPGPLLRRCEAVGVPVVQTYGLTEAASQVATLAPEDALRKLGSAGKPLFGTEVRIVDATGQPCAAGDAGEIVVRGPTVSPGYLNRREESTRPLRDGWLHTGDIGYLDDDGYLYILDRRDDLIVSGGENVYPAEIEAVLQSHPAVSEAGVWGVEHPRWGQAPMAMVVLREGLATTPELLIEYCRERLAAYKVPSRIEFTDGLPRNAAGKLLRSELRRRT